MFEYFPKNYVWNISVDIAIESGAQIGEIDAMCRPLRDAVARGEKVGTPEFFSAWLSMGDQLTGLADDDEALGRNISASNKLHRAALYYVIAERMQSHGFEPRMAAFRKGLELFTRAVKLGRDNLERVEVPYLGGAIPAWLTVAPPVEGKPAPCVIFCNGLDSSKEMLVGTRFGAELRRRGVSTLHIDQPGSGEALRAHGLTAVYDSERWASPLVDYLETRSDVDPKRIGMMGLSLGGYFAPRAVAFEPRFALGAVWGANHDWREVQKRRIEREGELPVPHYWEHVRWVWGAKDMDEFMTLAENVHLDGVLDRIKVPFLVTHGENDRQIPLVYAHKTFDGLINSPKRELKVFTAREQGVEHVSIDNHANARDFIADWIAETFGTHTA